MITRVRYTESNGVLASKPMLAGTRLVYVVIDTVNNDLKVLDKANDEVLAKDSAVDLNVAKKKAKNLLRTLGVNFYDEVRRRNSNLNKAAVVFNSNVELSNSNHLLFRNDEDV